MSETKSECVDVQGEYTTKINNVITDEANNSLCKENINFIIVDQTYYISCEDMKSIINEIKNYCSDVCGKNPSTYLTSNGKKKITTEKKIYFTKIRDETNYIKQKYTIIEKYITHFEIVENKKEKKKSFALYYNDDILTQIDNVVILTTNDLDKLLKIHLDMVNMYILNLHKSLLNECKSEIRDLKNFKITDSESLVEYIKKIEEKIKEILSKKKSSKIKEAVECTIKNLNLYIIYLKLFLPNKMN